MTRLLSRPCAALVCVGLAAVLTSCERSNQVGLPIPALAALNSIYLTSSGRLHNLKVDVEVGKEGMVEVAMQGQLTSNPGGEGDVWIPALIVSKLPPYFQIVEPNDTSDMSLEAYQFKGGLWCIALVMKEPNLQSVSAQGGKRARLQPSKFTPESSRGNANREQEGGSGSTGGDLDSSSAQETFAPQSLQFKIALAAPEFSNSLPFQIPAQTQDPVTISVNLPEGAHFSQSEVVLDMTTAPHWRANVGSEVFEAAQTTRPQALTNIPSALANKGPRVAATLYSTDAVAWDLSPVTFSPPGFFTQFKSWFLPSVLLLAFCAVGLWVRTDRLAGFRSWLKELERSQQKLVEAIEREVEDTSEFWSQVKESGETPIAPGKRWGAVAAAITARLDVHAFGRGFPEVERMWGELRWYESEVEALKSQPGQNQRMLEGALARVVLLNQRLKMLAESEARFNRVRKEVRSWKRAFWILAALVVGCAVFLLATLARAQGPFQSSAGRGPKLMLYDLEVALVPLDTQAKPEKINVTLKFSSVSADRKQSTSTVQIGSGRNSITMEPVSPLIDNKVSLVQHSNNLITLDVPTSYSPTLRRIWALSQSVIQYKVPRGYPNEVLLANQLSFSYTMSGAEAVHTRFTGIHWLHRFPFDYAEVDIPIDVRRSALLSHLELQKPASDYFAHVTVDGLPIDLAENENGDHYDYANADPMVRTPIWAGQTVTLRATFKRAPWQSWGLVAMVLIFGAAGGAVAGLPKKSSTSRVLTMLGFTTLVFGVRTAVLAVYKELPTLLTLQGTTIFELAFLLALVLMVLAFFVTRKMIP